MLRRFAVTMVQEGGWVSEQALQEFLEAGYERRHVLDVVTLVAMKTLSNYTNHIAQAPLDEAFRSTRWKAA